jgi:hypothetical protein
MFLPSLGTNTLLKTVKGKIKRFLFALPAIPVCMLLSTVSFGQVTQDSLKIRLDQLEFRIDSLEQELENANSNMVSVSDLQSIFTSTTKISRNLLMKIGGQKERHWILYLMQ